MAADEECAGELDSSHGPIGHKRAGVWRAGMKLSDYRRCYSCGGNTPEDE